MRWASKWVTFSVPEHGQNCTMLPASNLRYVHDISLHVALRMNGSENANDEYAESSVLLGAYIDLQPARAYCSISAALPPLAA